MKAIHFYTNLTNEDQVSDRDLDTMCVDYASTSDAIYGKGDDVVKTTQLSFLSNVWDYIDMGYRVLIHNDLTVIEIKENMCAPDGKEIRRGHNIERLLIGGVFGKLL